MTVTRFTLVYIAFFMVLTGCTNSQSSTQMWESNWPTQPSATYIADVD
jgi:hypothetical protein